METKDIGIIKLDKGTKKVPCHKFYCKEIDRELMIHTNVDNKNHISISDVRTGMRLTGLSVTINKLKMEQVEEELDRWIKHFTIPMISEEFKKYEDIK